MTESYLGIDVGFCKARRTTGLCLLTLNRDCLEWICRKTGSDKPQRRKDLRELIPKGTDISAVGIDGPLARNLKRVNYYRVADVLLTRGSFQRRCKPGPTGKQLHWIAGVPPEPVPLASRAGDQGRAARAIECAEGRGGGILG